jgi:GNAT superfamily N-acetyltransferase
MPLHLLTDYASHNLRPLFDVPHLGFVVDAMCAGNSPASVWLDDEINPRSAFIWDTTHSLYLGGDADNSAFNASLRNMLTETILPEGKARGLGIYKIYTANDGWASRLPDLFQTDSLLARERTLFKLDPASQFSPENPPGFHVQRVDRALLADSQRPNAGRVVEEIQSCWTALDRFWTSGFGYCALTHVGEIAAWCTAEYVSGPTCGVGIETVEAFQGQGVGTLVARAFAQHCMTNGWTARWDSWSSNTPSVKVAEKTGFRKLLDYTISIYQLDS